MQFSKYHGLGNDFIILHRDRPLKASEARRLCDRRFGIGGDGLIAALPPDDPQNDLKMDLLNQDGSRPEMCGNGIRTLTRYAVTQLGMGAPSLSIETPAGVRHCRWAWSESGDFEVEVAMGQVQVHPLQRLEVAGRTFEGHPTDVGNPHFVIFEHPEPEAARRFGPALEQHAAFPDGANIEFVRWEPPAPGAPPILHAEVWERGCGLTLACGTGATAVAAAALQSGRQQGSGPIQVRLPGGTLEIRFRGDQAFMTGPATHVYDGRWRGESP